MFNGPDGNNYLGTSFIFIHDLYIHIVALKLTLNNNTRGSHYNAEILEEILKADYHFSFPTNSITVISDTTNADTKVDNYFSEDTEQVNCEMHQISSAMKYGFGVLENTIFNVAVDENGLRIKLSNSKWKRVSDIVTPGAAFPPVK